MSLLWAAKAAKAARNKNEEYTPGSSRWVSNELSNQFMDSFNSIDKFGNIVSSDYESLASTMDQIYLGTLDPDSLKIPHTSRTPISLSPAKSSTSNTKIFSNDKIEITTPALRDNEHKPVEVETNIKLQSEDLKNVDDDDADADDSFQKISKSIRRNTLGKTSESIPGPTLSSSKDSTTLNNRSSRIELTKSNDKSAISKRSRSSVFVALPQREPIMIKQSAQKSRTSTLKSSVIATTVEPVTEPYHAPESVITEEKFDISPVKLPRNESFLEKFTVDPIPASNELKDKSDTLIEETSPYKKIWDQIGNYRTLSPVRKSKSPVRLKSADHSRLQSRSPSRVITSIKSPPKTALPLALTTKTTDQTDLISRLTTPTSASSAKAKPQNHKIETKKPERNKFMATNLIPKQHSPTKAKTDLIKNKVDVANIPKLKIPVIEKRVDPMNKNKQKIKLKPTSLFRKKSGLRKSHRETNNSIHQEKIPPSSPPPAPSPPLVEYKPPQARIVQPKRKLPREEDRNIFEVSPRKPKKIKTANGIALPDAARGGFKRQKSIENASTPLKSKINNILPITPLKISPGSLPQILSDDEFGSTNNRVLKSWANSPNLRREISSRRTTNPANVLTYNPKIDMMQTFKNTDSVMRGQQSPMPSPDKQEKAKEVKRYAQQMGYIS
ncbi:hypothetical protein G210_3007 [Candida maltosa Xu316]|uniref:Inner centromere protein ARK-binding domain-containing protein n=1 Tax=Candida maltosa (strain Xu316) TaxID=1245528 RepID=M3IK11_CANMX|nr:hypothetical protein G210_3007 [Candida maltosa Xu316]